MISLEFKHAAIADALTRASEILSDMRPIHEDIGEYMIEATRARFRTRTAPDGSRWRAKSPTTIAAYLARGDGNRPHPLIGPSGRLGREIAKLVTPTSTEIGSALEYSGVMQHGAAKGAFGTNRRKRPIPWGNIPARVWLGISDQDEASILEIVDRHVAAPFE